MQGRRRQGPASQSHTWTWSLNSQRQSDEWRSRSMDSKPSGRSATRKGRKEEKGTTGSSLLPRSLSTHPVGEQHRRPSHARTDASCTQVRVGRPETVSGWGLGLLPSVTVTPSFLKGAFFCNASAGWPPPSAARPPPRGGGQRVRQHHMRAADHRFWIEQRDRGLLPRGLSSRGGGAARRHVLAARRSAVSTSRPPWTAARLRGTLTHSFPEGCARQEMSAWHEEDPFWRTSSARTTPSAASLGLLPPSRPVLPKTGVLHSPRVSQLSAVPHRLGVSQIFAVFCP